MASIIKRNGRYIVIHYYFTDDGKKKQKWETYITEEEAEKRKVEIEEAADEQKEDFINIPKCEDVHSLFLEYVELYGKDKWALSTYESNIAIFNNYIDPNIGDRRLEDINVHFVEVFYRKLLRLPAVVNKNRGYRNNELVSLSTVRDIHKLLRSCFHQAVKWELMEKNPAENATVPKYKPKKRAVWDEETLMTAIEVCKNIKLKIAISVSFACTLRIGEMLGLTWDCINITDDAIENEDAYLYVDKELQRVEKSALTALNAKDVIYVFPEQSQKNKTVVVLKKPKTESSIRKVYLPNAVAYMLKEYKQKQEGMIKLVGDQYQDYNLVMATDLGTPLGEGYIRDRFNELIEEHGFPKVVFHSIRHSSVSYKLEISGGNIKAVQGDSGHAQAKMVTDLYAHISDAPRRKMAKDMNKSLSWGRKETSVKKDKKINDLSLPEGINMEQLTELLSDPEKVAMLKTLLPKD